MPPVLKPVVVVGGGAVRLNCFSFAVAFETLPLPSFVVELHAVIPI